MPKSRTLDLLNEPNFWHHLPKPFFALAPMEAVTDTVFRRVVAQAGKPDVFFTEFTNTDSFCSPRGHDSTMGRLTFTPGETPLIAQIWGTNPEHFAQMAKELAGMGFAGIDINMGCPERRITKHGACSALIHNPALAAQIIAATKQGGLPVSVKTRLGVKTQITEEWIGFLLQQDLAALTVHARTVTDMSAVPARWDQVAVAVQLRDQLAPRTVIIGNGDVTGRADGLAKIAQTGADGIMIGRGVFKDVFCFEPGAGDPVAAQPRQPADYLALLHLHLDLFDQAAAQGHARNYQALKRFFKVYIKEFNGAKELREALMGTNNTQEARAILQQTSLAAPISTI